MTWKIWALGSNGNGQLAIGHRNDVDQPTSCLFDRFVQPPPAAVRPRKIVAGGNHTILLYEDGSAYAAGLNDDGRCGLPATPEPITAFRRVVFSVNGQAGQEARHFIRFVDITATWSSTTFVAAHPTTPGQEIYSCGTGDYGELGQGPDVTISTTPRLVTHLGQGSCVNLASSFRHVVALMDNGYVLGWGNGRKYQLGNDIPRPPANRPLGSVWKPWPIADLKCNEAFARGLRLACGREFTYMLPSEGLEAGDESKNMFWLLGLNVKKDDKYGIKEHALSGSCRELQANWNTLHAIDTLGELHGIGRNDKGQILPARLKSSIIQNVKAGSEHSIAQIAVPGTVQNGKVVEFRSPEQCVVLWGWGEHGNCGPLKPGTPWLSRRYTLSRKYSIIALNVAKLEPLGAGCATTFVMANLDERLVTAKSHTFSYVAFPRDCDALRTNKEHEAGEDHDSDDLARPHWEIYAQVVLPNTA